MNRGRELGGKHGCHCLHEQRDEGGICYTQSFISSKAFVLLWFKFWEDVVGCFLRCWSHFRSCPAAFSEEQLYCQSSSPCRNCCSFLLMNCNSGAGSTQHREEEGEKCRPKWGRASLPGAGTTGVFTVGLQTHHLQELLVFVQQMCRERHFLSLLCFLEPAGNGGNIWAYPRWRKVPRMAWKSKFSYLILFKILWLDSYLKARHYINFPI